MKIVLALCPLCLLTSRLESQDEILVSWGWVVTALDLLVTSCMKAFMSSYLNLRILNWGLINPSTNAIQIGSTKIFSMTSKYPFKMFMIYGKRWKPLPEMMHIFPGHFGHWIKSLWYLSWSLKFTIKYWLLQIFWNLLCGLKIIQIFLTKIYRINQSVLVSILFAKQ